MQIEHPNTVPLGMPSPEALDMATAAIRRRNVLPETMEHPAVRAECLSLAYLIQAYGLASGKPAEHHVEPTASLRPAFCCSARIAGRPRRYVAKDARMPERVDA